MFIIWKKKDVVWLDAENANQIAVSHPFDASDDSHFCRDEHTWMFILSLPVKTQ